VEITGFDLFQNFGYLQRNENEPQLLIAAITVFIGGSKML